MRAGIERRWELIALVAVAVVVRAAWAEDWPQMGGPNANGVSTSTGLLDAMPEGGPRVVWEVAGLGGGYANPIVAAGRVFVMGRQTVGGHPGWSGQEVAPGPDVLTCLDRNTGRILWRQEFAVLPGGKDQASAWATPAADAERAYGRGGNGEVRALDAKDGRMLWRWPKEEPAMPAKNAGYGIAGGLALVDDLLVFQGTNGMTALDRRTGETRWEYPVPGVHNYTLGARNFLSVDVKGRKILLVSSDAVDAKTGRKLCSWGPGALSWWAGVRDNEVVAGSYKWLTVPKDQEEEAKKKYGNNFNTAIGLFCTAFDPTPDGGVTNRLVWEWCERGNGDLGKAFGGPLIGAKSVYGWLKGDGGDLVCLDRATGRTNWIEKGKGGLGYANAFLADGKVFTGALRMFADDPAGLRELGSAALCRGTWATPAIADGMLFVRDDYGTVKCLDLRAKAGAASRDTAAPAAIAGDEWPQADGPYGDGSADAKGLLREWPTNEFLKVVWEGRSEPGASVPVVAGGKVFLLGRKDWGMKKDASGQPVKTGDGKIARENNPATGEGPLVLACLNRANGQGLWRYAFQTNRPAARNTGPYATPVADGDRVFAIDGARELVGLAAASGQVVWRQSGDDILGAHDERTWGGDRLLVVGRTLLLVGQAGQAVQLAALDKTTGNLLWRKYFPAGTTPRRLRTATREYLAGVTPSTLHVLDADSTPLWQLRDDERQYGSYDPMSFWTSGQRLFVNRQLGMDAFEIASGGDGAMALRKLWTCEAPLANRMLTAGNRLFLFGSGGDNRSIKARDAATGRLLWAGSVDGVQFVGGVAADGRLVLLTSGSELLLVDAEAAQMRVVSRARIPGFEGSWTPPALAGGQLLLRDCSGLIKCVELRGR